MTKLFPRFLPRSIRHALVPVAMVILGASCTTEEVARYAIATTFAPEDQDTAVRVAKCESNFDPEARSPGNWGVFQINDVNRRAVEEAGLDWERVKVETVSNVQAALVVLERQGWRAWTCK